MRPKFIALGAITIGSTLAFPSVLEHISPGGGTSDFEKRLVAAIGDLGETLSPHGINRLVEKRNAGLEKRATFDPEAQLIQNTGKHRFIQPDLTIDLRGPCPGLNVLSNHNYLPRNGVGTIQQYFDACTSVFGMGDDLAALLSVLGATLSGDMVSWSQGGPPPTSLVSGTAGLLSPPQGISGSHNKYESDASPGRGDLYLEGNTYTLNMNNFNDLYKSQAKEANPNYSLDVLLAHHDRQFGKSLRTNPYFFYGPFTGVGVSAGAHIFVAQFFANRSAENPTDGILDKETLKSFFGVVGADDNLTHIPGSERIPDNWYRRAIHDGFTIPALVTAGVGGMSKYPRTGSVGGNLGTTNSFVGIDVANLTGGVYNAQQLTDPNKLACFLLEFATQGQFDILKGLFSTVTKAQDMLTAAFSKASAGMACPGVTLDTSAFEQFPGWSKLQKDGTYASSWI